MTENALGKILNTTGLPFFSLPIQEACRRRFLICYRVDEEIFAPKDRPFHNQCQAIMLMMQDAPTGILFKFIKTNCMLRFNYYLFNYLALKHHHQQHKAR